MRTRRERERERRRVSEERMVIRFADLVAGGVALFEERNRCLMVSKIFMPRAVDRKTRREARRAASLNLSPPREDFTRASNLEGEIVPFLIFVPRDAGARWVAY